MAIEKSFRNSEEIIKISDYMEKYKKTYDVIILTFQSKVLEKLFEHDLVKRLDLEVGSSYQKYPVYELKSHPKIAFYLCPIGAPIAVGVLEELTYILDCKKVVMYGSAGVLDAKITEKKIIIPTKAYRDEGTSYHYQASSDFIDIKNYEVVRDILEKSHVDHVLGYTWTTDAFYRETKAIMSERKSQGCIAVEMEVSAVQAFANLREIELYSFLYSADLLNTNGWDKRILGNLDLDSRLQFFMIAKAIAVTIIGD